MEHLFYGTLFAIIVIAAYWAVTRLPDGCMGDCQQGRRPCNCKSKETSNGSSL